MCMSALFACMYSEYVSGALKGQKQVLDPLNGVMDSCKLGGFK